MHQQGAASRANGGDRITRDDRGPVVLDGARLARECAPSLAARSAAVETRRGRPPRLALIAFEAADGTAPHVARKLRACEAAGVDVIPRILPAGSTTAVVRDTVVALAHGQPCDGIFVQTPFPDGVDPGEVLAALPAPQDVDVMTEGRIHRYLALGEGPPPVTVSAGLELLDAYEVDVAGRDSIVVAEPSPFARMFAAALTRRGAHMRPIVPPDASDLERRIGSAGLVVVAAGVPGLVRSGELATGAVVIDVGYFNPGGRGDVDTSDGIAHLAAIAPVPGGIGPMTVSVLVERVIEFAERSSPSFC